MKRIKSLNYLLVILVSLLVVVSCKKDKTTTTPTPTPTSNSIVPASMTVDVPSSLNSEGTSKSLKGNDIYQALRGFVYMGETGASIINGLCALVRNYDLTKITTVTFTGGDGLSKTLTMSSNVTYNATTWAWEMHVTDYDGTSALEFYWNVSPVKGVAIYQAYKLNHTAVFSATNKTAIIEIQYSEAETNYSKQMIVSIDSLTHPQTNEANNIQMFVGMRRSDTTTLDIYGNSNIPNAIIVDPNHKGGYQWAFVAHSKKDLDISIAKVSLPPCNYANNDTTSLWGKYSIYNVLSGELSNLGFPQDSISVFLKNANAPGYFEKGIGFIACGYPAPTTPAGFTPSFCDLSALAPYIPLSIKNLNIQFGKK